MIVSPVAGMTSRFAVVHLAMIHLGVVHNFGSFFGQMLMCHEEFCVDVERTDRFYLLMWVCLF